LKQELRGVLTDMAIRLAEGVRRMEYRIQMWILLVRAMMRCLVAESRLAAGVFKGDIAQATFSDVVASSLTNLAQFGEAIVLGKRWGWNGGVQSDCRILDIRRTKQ
jgi:hypothetical protein